MDATPELKTRPLQSPFGISIRLKIFGIASSLLGLLVIVVLVSVSLLRRVNHEITALADYILPITDEVAEIDVHALEQELHFERVQKLYEIEPLDEAAIATEIVLFEERGDLVDEELLFAEDLTEQAQNDPTLAATHDTWATVLPLLKDIEQAHQAFHDHALDILQLLEAGDFENARVLEAQLAAEEEDFNGAINEIFLTLEALTVEASRTGQRHQARVQILSVVIAAIAAAFGFFYAAVVTLGLIRPIRRLTQSMAAVQQGQLDTHLVPTSRDEIAALGNAFNGMVQELRLKAQLETTFGKYVDPRIVKNLMDEGAATAGERQVMTVAFVVVTGVEAFAETLPAAQRVDLLNRYLSLMSNPITEHDGVIDKFIGPVIMGFWGPPFVAETDHPLLACQAVTEQWARVERVRQALAEISESVPPLSFHAGLATGSLVVGNMGSDTAKSYTVMGDTVNIAARLKGVSQQYGVSTVITAETQAAISETFATRALDLIQVVGKQEPVQVYELLGPGVSETVRLAWDEFELGLTADRQRQWEQAQQAFDAVLQQMPNDRPAQLYLERLVHFRDHPPPEDWQGVWQLDQK
ncbi:MAG: adenylate/guanylate cyclase domain-containing protein [Leptolyngbyaceae cyanobacterium]